MVEPVSARLAMLGPEACSCDANSPIIHLHARTCLYRRINEIVDEVEAAAQWVAERRDAYIEEHGSYDYSTGATEFPRGGEEYVGELDEIEEGLRALRREGGA